MAKQQKPRSTTNSAESEVEAYIYTRNQLEGLGWHTKSPDRDPVGQVWTQNQCLGHPEIKRCLGKMRPEYIVKLSESRLWVIEAKSKRSALDQALREAECDYAAPIVRGGVLTVPLISGVAGNETSGYDVRTYLMVNGRYEVVTINGVEATGLLAPSLVKTLLETGNPHIADLQVDEGIFLTAAEDINATLHKGGINKNERARVMAALLLALLNDSGPSVDSELQVLIGDINARSKGVLRTQGKSEFFPFVEIDPPTSEENHVKYKAALVRTIQVLKNLNIKSAMNSGTDVLGKFYEVFLRYGNGAKEIGIVLTPRHVTRFAVEAIGVGPSDIVLDPACGTGGFLVAAFDHVRRTANAAQIDHFKQHCLFGIEQESYVAALAIVNMIFRGDGKNNIKEGNGLSKFLQPDQAGGRPTAKYASIVAEKGHEPVTRVFMNPPFALKKSDESESRFVSAALKSMADGGILFAIVPMSVVTESGDSLEWRKLLLKNHTLLSVISFPEELFYPVANQTVGLILRKGAAHPRAQPVLWCRVLNDGFRKSKRKRLAVGGENDLDRLRPKIRTFLADQCQSIAEVPEVVRVAPVDMADPLLELTPEAYLSSAVPSPAELGARLDIQIRENISALVGIDLMYGGDKHGKQAHRSSILNTGLAGGARQGPEPSWANVKFKPVVLDTLFAITAGEFHNLSDLDPGDVPVVSCADSGNGVAALYDVEEEACYRDALTIAFNGWPLTTKIHPYTFGAKDDVAVAIPKDALSPEALVFIQAALNAERWRFSYYRKCFKAKLLRTEVELPVLDDGKLDVVFMEAVVRAQPYWWFLAPRYVGWKPAAHTFENAAAEATSRDTSASAEAEPTIV